MRVSTQEGIRYQRGIAKSGVRGERRNALMRKALQFESASWTWEGINGMLKATKSMRAKVVRTQQPTTVEKLLRKKKVMKKSSRRRRNCLIGNYE